MPSVRLPCTCQRNGVAMIAMNVHANKNHTIKPSLSTFYRSVPVRRYGSTVLFQYLKYRYSHSSSAALPARSYAELPLYLGTEHGSSAHPSADQ